MRGSGLEVESEGVEGGFWCELLKGMEVGDMAC